MKSISYRSQFIDTVMFMASSFSNLVNNLSGGVYRIKFKDGQDDKKCEICRNNIYIKIAFLNTQTLKMI